MPGGPWRLPAFGFAKAIEIVEHVLRDLDRGMRDRGIFEVSLDFRDQRIDQPRRERALDGADVVDQLAHHFLLLEDDVAELVLQLDLRLAQVARAPASVFSGIALLSASGDSGILPSISGMKITWPFGVVWIAKPFSRAFCSRPPKSSCARLLYFSRSAVRS